MRTILALLLMVVSFASRVVGAGWMASAWTDENTIELRTTDSGAEPHWFPVWFAVIDGALYVRLGSRAAARWDRNVTKPIVGARIAGTTFERVRGVLAPEMAERVAAAMAERYWLQGDVLIRRLDHPYTLRLEPEPAAP
jgi:hypothetical protein